MAQTIQIYRTNSNTAPAPLLPGALSAELGPFTKLWVGSGTGNRLLYSSNPGDITAHVTVGATPPVSGTQGDLYWDSVAGQLYVYYTDANSSAWVTASTVGPPTVAVALTPPTGAQNGQLWWDLNLGQLFVFVNDGTSQQWIAASNAAST